MRACGQLTAGLLLRALLSGNATLFEAALVGLSDLAPARVRGLMHDWRSAGFAALYRKAKLPERLLPAFRAALQALYTIEAADESGARLSRQRIERVLTSCEAANDGELDKLVAVLRRFETEAARDEARDFSIALPAQDRCIQDQFVSAIAVPQRHEEPLLLTDPDPGPEIVRAFSTPAQRREPRFLSIDLAAIEAELAAA